MMFYEQLARCMSKSILCRCCPRKLRQKPADCTFWAAMASETDLQWATANGYTAEVVSSAVWTSKTAAEFKTYKALVETQLAPFPVLSARAAAVSVRLVELERPASADQAVS